MMADEQPAPHQGSHRATDDDDDAIVPFTDGYADATTDPATDNASDNASDNAATQPLAAEPAVTELVPVRPTAAIAPPKRRRWRLIALVSLPVLLVLVAAAGTANYLRPLPEPVITLAAVPAQSSFSIDWPGYGQSAIGAEGYGVLGTDGAQTPFATASIAKVITALCVLQKLPLALGRTGPTFTVTAADLARYQADLAAGDSVAAVALGEQLTEYQALQALMLPSANNIADSLANWVFGGQAQYARYATAFLTRYALTHTRIGKDASGLDDSTVSTASDLTGLGLLAARDPVLMQIAGQEQATLPVAGTVYNYNTVLGKNGITGLKTGNNDTDTGAFLFTTTVTVAGQKRLAAGAVMGAPDLQSALDDAVRLAGSLHSGFEQLTVVTAGQVLGSARTAWGASSQVVAATTVRFAHWRGYPVTTTVAANPARHGQVGTVVIRSRGIDVDVALVLRPRLAGPGTWWRLTRTT